MSTQTIERMAVEVAGSGPDVVMLHGLGGSSNTFTPQMGVFGERFRTIRPDLPGSARSAVPSALSIQSMADAVIAMAGTLGVEQACFVGHSMGTIVCQHVAVKAPKLVAGLVLFGPLTAPAEAAREGLRGRARMAREGGAAAMADIADAIVQAATASATKERQPAVLAAVRESVMRQPAEGYALNCLALADAAAADAAVIRCPTLLVTGEDDAVAPPSVTRGLAERIEGARCHVLPHCGHWTTLEAAAEVNRLLKEFNSTRR